MAGQGPLKPSIVVRPHVPALDQGSAYRAKATWEAPVVLTT